MTSNIRRSLFQLLMILTIDNENTVMIESGDEVDKWYVVLNGQFKVVVEGEEDRIYSVGDA